MSGRRHIIDKRGELYEDAVKSMLSPSGVMVNAAGSDTLIALCALQHPRSFLSR
jgi:hypothetical protein